MSEQQKDPDVSSIASAASAPADPDQAISPNKSEPATEAVKPKRRASSKAKAEQAQGDEAAKPKKPRASSRGAKAKNVPAEVPENADAQSEARQGQAASPQPAHDKLPPLPPPPDPTPEGIAFMQKHVAYQNALDERSELRRSILARLPQALNQDPQRGSKPLEGKSGTVASGRIAQENSIEAGPAIRKSPVSEADLQAVRDAEDAQLMRVLLDRSRALRGVDRPELSGEQATAAAQADVGTLRSIKDAVVRRLGLAVVEQNRNAEVEYRKEFDKLAPDLKQAAEEAGIAKPAATSASPPSKEQADEQAAARLTAVPESVRKRFLKVDSDYYFPDRSPAFADRGRKLATRGEHPEVVRALVEIAKERGWDSVTVKGSETFRRAAWMEAAQNGLQVTGYKPTDLDLAQLKQREPKNSIEPGPVREQADGQRLSLVKTPAQDDKVLNEKVAAFTNDKPTLVVKKYPELVQAYAMLDAARKFAETHMPGYEAKFVEIGKELLTQQLRQGKEVVGPKVYPDQISHSRTGRQAAEAKAASSEQLIRER